MECKIIRGYITLISSKKNPIQDSELLTREDNYNEIILNGLRLSNGINRELLKEYQDIINNESLERVNKKWDCILITNEKIKLTNKGFLFVDEISKDLFI